MIFRLWRWGKDILGVIGLVGTEITTKRVLRQRAITNCPHHDVANDIPRKYAMRSARQGSGS